MSIQFEPLTVCLDKVVPAKFNLIVEINVQLLPHSGAPIKQLRSIESPVLAEELARHFRGEFLLDFLKIEDVVNEFVLREGR